MLRLLVRDLLCLRVGEHLLRGGQRVGRGCERRLIRRQLGLIGRELRLVGRELRLVAPELRLRLAEGELERLLVLGDGAFLVGERGLGRGNGKAGLP